MVVIAYHSLEDRIVKRAFREDERLASSRRSRCSRPRPRSREPARPERDAPRGRARRRPREPSRRGRELARPPSRALGHPVALALPAPAEPDVRASRADARGAPADDPPLPPASAGAPRAPPAFLVFASVVIVLLVLGLVALNALFVQTTFAVHALQPRVAELADSRTCSPRGSAAVSPAGSPPGPSVIRWCRPTTS